MRDQASALTHSNFHAFIVRDTAGSSAAWSVAPLGCATRTDVFTRPLQIMLATGLCYAQCLHRRFPLFPTMARWMRLPSVGRSRHSLEKVRRRRDERASPTRRIMRATPVETSTWNLCATVAWASSQSCHTMVDCRPLQAMIQPLRPARRLSRSPR